MRIVLSATETAAEHGAELPFAPAVFGVVAFGVLMALLLITYAFRSVWTRH